MTRIHKPRRRQRAMAARQALSLCETDLSMLTPGRHGAGPHQPAALPVQARPPRPRTVSARAALLAAGVPPRTAATLRRRLQLIPEQEDQP